MDRGFGENCDPSGLGEPGQPHQRRRMEDWVADEHIADDEGAVLASGDERLLLELRRIDDGLLAGGRRAPQSGCLAREPRSADGARGCAPACTGRDGERR